ncbi:alpha-N-arabinofuranosidase [Bacteroides intestinalis CAG:315]|jgi:alpha-N-arabinofuranosidase|uniref:non-reducing end alpha-L-arabinofuranosidase n=1 Tax=Bacteroides intestinalis TaxID=329854 RepID=A0A412YAQ4_9BACE|nr:alpha-L-arabinofuranosidase C-terminal domain-containing protein [Bacteroides intestinalis]RGV54660.1 alpha-N-arabinofuranosidase [Bacteroides intestinalis]RHA62886.1 alpha-N-arabinofuranosidase [Bacteroides intestinalis]CDD94318.1 alpha-N-arabinofuranosidase [Bacteroides intestinalis CAG:315]
MKTFLLTLALTASTSLWAQSEQAVITIQANQPRQTISKHIYGHFAEHLGRCIYDGFWVDPNMNVPKDGRIRMDIVNALRDISVPNLRWPGGCYADEYQWRDGIGDPAKRPVTLNSHWGGVTEDNSFGTDEFMKLCKLLGCEPYLSANMGTSTPKDLRDWIEYLNFSGKTHLTQLREQNGHKEPYGVSFFGIGNESWGCGGNMTPEYYAEQYRVFQEYARNYSNHPIKKIASGPNSADYNWMEVCLKKIPSYALWGISLHYYTIATGNWGQKGSSTQFDEKEYFGGVKNALYMETLVKNYSAMMNKYDPEEKIALVVDEWGIWTDVEPGTNPGFLYQQNTMRDALIAASTLNIFNNHSNRVRMANLAQAINVLQALILTDKEKMLLTPTYHIFKMYKVHQEANLLESSVSVNDYQYGNESIPGVNVSASKDENGKIHVSVVNLNPKKAVPANVILNGYNAKQIKGEILTSASYTDYNSFDKPDKIAMKEYKDFKKESNGNISMKLPPLSIVTLEIQ